MTSPPQAAEPAIRTAEERDLDDVAAIERAVFNDPWSRRSFADLLDAAQVVFLVAVSDTAVLGYAVVLVASPESELANLAVARLVQGQGLGRRLLRAGIAAASERGCRQMFLEVRASNGAAIGLYQSAGFEALGRRRKYYARPEEDAVVMRANLSLASTGTAGRGVVGGR